MRAFDAELGPWACVLCYLVREGALVGAYELARCFLRAAPPTPEPCPECLPVVAEAIACPETEAELYFGLVEQRVLVACFFGLLGGLCFARCSCTAGGAAEPATRGVRRHVVVRGPAARR